MTLRSVDQPALAGGIGVTQGTISLILLGKTRRSKHLPDIAAYLRVNLDWLMGRSDEMEPTAGTSRAIPIAARLFSLPVYLPSEAALEAAYSGLLRASRGMDEAELARELAKRLPTILRVAGEEAVAPLSVAFADQRDIAEAPGDARPVERQASRSA